MRKPQGQAPESASYPEVGAVLAGRYHLDMLISVGGMGAIFRATDSFLDQTVAIKVLLTQNWDANTAEVAKALANLRSEARSSIKLTHPNIIRAYNYERDASWEFMVMEFVEGEDLRKYRKRLPGKILPTDEVIRIGIAALNGLEHAHSVGIIHYDIKPANILLTSQKEIKLCDFGLSVLTALGATDQVQPRDNELMVIGTPGYVSPEMIVNGKADHRTDLYAMAATLFDLCSGAPPFGHSSEQAFYGHVRLPIPDIANLRRPLMDVIRRGLDKNPEIRFQSAAAMRAALEAAAEAMRKEATAETAVGPKPRVAEDAPRAEERPATPAPRAAAVAPRAAAVAPRAEPAPAADDGIQVSTLSYSLDKKAWSAPFPPLDSERTLVLAFGAPELLDHPAPIAELAQAFPHSQVIGCSTAGEIIGTEVRDRSLSVSVVRFARTHLASATVQVTDPNQSFSAGEALARKLNRQGLRAVFVLSEGLKVNGSELVRGFNSVLGTGVTVTGGLSGDGSRFQRTWVISGGKAQPGIVCAVGLYGEHLVIAHGSKGGWDVFGPERRVTRSEGNVLHELDGKPALALYKQYLGDKADGLPATGLLFPLALRLPGEKDKVLVRTLLAVDATKNSMTFAGDIPKGSTVQLMKANFDRLIGGASSAALMAKELLQDNKVQPQSLAIAISCVGRRLVLGDRTDEEIEAVRDVLPQGTRISGFYSYGELSPYASGSCDLHNQTMTLTFLSEKPSQAARPAAASTAAASTTAGAAARKPQSLAPPLPPPSPSASMGPEDTRPHVLPNGVAKPKQPVPLGTEPAGPTERAATRPHVPSPFHDGVQVMTLWYSIDKKVWSAPFPPLDSERTLVLAFGAPELIDQPGPIAELAQAFPNSQVIGCSTAGEIIGTEVRDRSLSVSIIRFARTNLASATVQVADPNQSFSAGEALARKLNRQGLRAVFVLSEGLKVNGSELVRGFNSVLGTGVTVTGGLSGDGSRFQRTWVISGGKVQPGLVCAVGLYGEHLRIAHGSKGGWDVFGPERRVTRSEGNVLHELDGKPALALYKQYLGDKADGLPATGLLFPLALRLPGEKDKVLVRTLLAVDAVKNSMTFAGDIPKGSTVQLMKANFDRLIGGASSAALMAKELIQDTDAAPPQSLAIAISCVGRRLVLGDRTDEEIEAVLDVLPQGTRISGFYSYGELSPYATGSCDLHNQTMTLTVLSEAPPAVEKPAGAQARAAARPPPSPPLPTTTEMPAQKAALPFDDSDDLKMDMPTTAMAPPWAAALAAASKADAVPTQTGLPVTAASPPPPPPSVRAVAAAEPPPVRAQPAAEPPPARPQPAAEPPAARPQPARAVPVSEASPSQIVRTRLAAPSGVDGIREQKVGDITVVFIQGRLTEAFQGRALGKRLSGVVVFDLSGVERITSFGVREWLEMLSEAAPSITQLYLARCSESVVTQLNMIRPFGGNGTVVSFYAPYQCDSCKQPFDRLIDSEEDGASLRSGRAPAATCPHCQGSGAFDDEPASYFAFVSKQAAAPIPAEIREALRAAIAGEGKTEPASNGEAVEKHVEGRATTLKFRGRLDDSLRWSRVLDGLEGEVVLDLGGVTGTTPEGARRFEAAVRELGQQKEIERLALRACPPALVERLAQTEPTGALIESATVDGHCPRCAAARPALIQVDKERETLLAGRDPHAVCRRCNAALTFQTSRVLLGFLAQQGAPTGGAQALPAASATPASPAKRRRTRMVAVGAGLGLVIAASAIPVFRSRSAEPAPKPLQVAAVQPAPAVPLAQPKDLLPPAWVERPFAIEGQEVLVVGHGSAANPEAALEQARAEAISRLVEEALSGLSGTPYYDFVRSRAEGDAQAEARAWATRRYLAQHGDRATPLRAQVEVRPKAEGVEVYAQYKLGASAFKEVVDSYRATASFRGLTVARVFPLMERARPAPELVVIDVQPRSPAAQAGIAVGDALVSLNGRRVESIPSFTQISGELDRGPSKTLSLALSADGTERTVHLPKARPGWNR